MAELNDQQKLQVVLALARFVTPTEIVNEFRAAGVEVSHNQIGSYDPTRTYYEASEKWRVIFEEERERYIKDVASVPIANQGFRLGALQRNYEHAIKTKNMVLANQTLRQAAEEVGGALTNERNVNVKRPLDELTPDERRAQFEELIRKVMESKDPLTGNQPAPAALQ